MVKFKLIISNPKTKKVTVTELEGPKALPLVGREIGDVIDGSIVGLSGSKIRITGGSDKDGIPMRPDVHGGGKKYIILSGGVGFRPKKPGERQRKLVRGRVITDETYQINMVIEENEEKGGKT
jgi:small subunit ribosomal protein S6e